MSEEFRILKQKFSNQVAQIKIANFDYGQFYDKLFVLLVYQNEFLRQDKTLSFKVREKVVDFSSINNLKKEKLPLGKLEEEFNLRVEFICYAIFKEHVLLQDKFDEICESAENLRKLQVEYFQS